MIVGYACPKHGYVQGDSCDKCVKEHADTGVRINTYDWITKGEWEHIDAGLPNMRLSSKTELIKACESRGLIPKAFMKPKSQGKGFEISRRGY